LSAAETGHLVLSTLHTVDAGQTINRILGMFDKDEEKLVRIRLADTLRWIVSQRLLPKVSGGRAAALEVMGTNLRVKESVLNGEAEGKTFYEIIEAAEPFGMQTFDQSIIRLFQDGLITEDTALAYASRKSVTRRGVDDYKKKHGLVVSDIDDLGLDKEYGQATLRR
jgi:twitching motility protein PilT